MGNEQSKKQSISAQVEIQLSHPRVRFIKVVNNPKQRHMQTSFSTDKDEFIKWATLLLTKKLNSNHLLLPLTYEYEAAQFCGTSGQVKVNYESYPYLLTEEIESRRHKKRRFNQTELWLLLYCLLEGQKEMRSHSQAQLGLGDVRPENIFLNEAGLMKVACGWSWPKETSNYQKFLENQVTYLAPQDIPFIEQQKVDNSENTKSQTFSIGLTILAAANLTSYNHLYNISKKKFATQEFIHALNEWRLNEFYSDIFKSTLASMLEIDPAKRIDEKLMFDWIEGYRENILGRKDFVINDPPQVIIDEVEIIKGLYETVVGSRYNNEVGKGMVESSKRVVISGGENKQFVPTLIPPLVQQQTISNNINPNIATQSIYTPISNQKPIVQQQVTSINTSTTPIQFQFMNRTSVPTLYSQTKTLTENVYTKNYVVNQEKHIHQQYSSTSGNGLLSMGKMNFSEGDITGGYVPKSAEVTNKSQVNSQTLEGQESAKKTFQIPVNQQSSTQQQQQSSPNKQ